MDSYDVHIQPIHQCKYIDRGVGKIFLIMSHHPLCSLPEWRDMEMWSYFSALEKIHLKRAYIYHWVTIKYTNYTQGHHVIAFLVCCDLSNATQTFLILARKKTNNSLWFVQCNTDFSDIISPAPYLCSLTLFHQLSIYEKQLITRIIVVNNVFFS